MEDFDEEPEPLENSELLEEPEPLDDSDKEPEPLKDFGEGSGSLGSLNEDSEPFEGLGEESAPLEDLEPLETPEPLEEPESLEDLEPLETPEPLEELEPLEDLGDQPEPVGDSGKELEPLEDLGNGPESLEDYGEVSAFLEDLKPLEEPDHLEDPEAPLRGENGFVRKGIQEKLPTTEKETIDERKELKKKQENRGKGGLPDEMIQEIRNLWKKGCSRSEIHTKFPEICRESVYKYTRDIKSPTHRGGRLSNDEIEQLRRLRSKGHSHREIEKMVPFKVSLSAIKNHIKEVELDKKQIERLKKKRLDNLKQAHKKKDTPAEKIREVRELRKKGFSIGEIQEKTNLTSSLISRHTKDIKLTKKQKERLEEKKFKATEVARIQQIDAARDRLDRIIKRRHAKWDPTKYVNANTKVEITCRDGHVFRSVPGSIMYQETWCPECSEGRSERICRNMFEAIFNEKFTRVRPEWLVTDEGIRLELDGYCQKLALAFEYQGEQHYHYNPFFYETREDFEKRVANDQKKRELCEKQGLTLIEIPFTVPYDQMPEYIITKCKEKKIEVPESAWEIDFEEIIHESYGSLEKNEDSSQSRIDDYFSSEEET